LASACNKVLIGNSNRNLEETNVAKLNKLQMLLSDEEIALVDQYPEASSLLVVGLADRQHLL